MRAAINEMASLGSTGRALHMSMAVLDKEGAEAVFEGKRYVLIPNYQFQVDLQFKSLERKVTLSLRDQENELDGVAAFKGSPRRITMMGVRPRDAEILVIFATLDERERAEWGVTEEQARRWPCRLDYEADEQTGNLERWRLVLDIPREEIARIVDIATSPGVHELTLAVHLIGLYMPEGEVSEKRWPRANLAYLLPKSFWGAKIPRVYGYASWLVVNQRAFGR